MQKANPVNVNTIGPLGILWVTFIILKVMEIIHWSWWIVVFWPLVAWLVLIVAFGGLAALILGVAHIHQKSKAKA